ncbi:pilus assembly protein PilP [Pseudomonas plecoglossicida]|uniref:pilus assembly protein PilP n=1 Tax=Pseudomonas plecoglossicida TaxID=70775 RepID=UPI0039779B0B
MSAVSAFAWLAAAEGSSRFRRAAPVLVAVALFGLGCAVRLPAVWQAQAHEEARHDDLHEQQVASTAQLAELAQLQAAEAVAGQRLQEARWHLAAGESMSDLLDRLTALGHAHGLLIERLDVHEGESHAGFNKIPLALQLVGHYTALLQWLDDWLGQARVLRSGDMNLVAVEGRPGLLRLQLQVDTYQASAPLPAPAVLARVPARAALLTPTLDPFAPRGLRLSGAGLGSVPLAQLEMVGSLSRGVVHEALLMAAGRLYRVRPGDRVGRDQGVVTQVDQHQVEVRERLFMAGVWHERTAFITLAKRLGKEAPDHDENSDEVGPGTPAVDAIGVGGALSG